MGGATLFSHSKWLEIKYGALYWIIFYGAFHTRELLSQYGPLTFQFIMRTLLLASLFFVAVPASATVHWVPLPQSTDIAAQAAIDRSLSRTSASMEQTPLAIASGPALFAPAGAVTNGPKGLIALQPSANAFLRASMTTQTARAIFLSVTTLDGRECTALVESKRDLFAQPIPVKRLHCL